MWNCHPHMVHIRNRDSDTHKPFIYSALNSVFFPLLLSDSGSVFFSAYQQFQPEHLLAPIGHMHRDSRHLEARPMCFGGHSVPGEGPYLHRPEVKGQKEKHGDKTAHETPAEPVTAHVGDDGTHSEKQVEKGGQRVPGKEPRRPSLRGATWAVSELTSRSAQSISGRGSKEGTKLERLIIISAFCFLPLEESRTFPSFDSKYHLPSLKPGHL